tara:strand:+ start:34 stop:615 length:582 start_codon:yes stop_codon:yes gene_type:complete
MNFYKVFDVKQHSTTKNFLLKEIEEAYGYECTTTDFKGDYLSFISKSNWNKSDLISPTSKICWPYFLTTEDNFSFQDFLKKEYGNMGNQWRVESQWYNQYESNSGSDHPWHNHEYSNSFGEDILTGSLTCIYYLEVIDESLMTVLKHPETGEEVIPEVKEGQILTMDGKIFHKSPRNFTNTRKTVISFNIIFR